MTKWGRFLGLLRGGGPKTKVEDDGKVTERGREKRSPVNTPRDSNNPTATSAMQRFLSKKFDQKSRSVDLKADETVRDRARARSPKHFSLFGSSKEEVPISPTILPHPTFMDALPIEPHSPVRVQSPSPSKRERGRSPCVTLDYSEDNLSKDTFFDKRKDAKFNDEFRSPLFNSEKMMRHCDNLEFGEVPLKNRLLKRIPTNDTVVPIGKVSPITKLKSEEPKIHFEEVHLNDGIPAFQVIHPMQPEQIHDQEYAVKLTSDPQPSSHLIKGSHIHYVLYHLGKSEKRIVDAISELLSVRTNFNFL